MTIMDSGARVIGANRLRVIDMSACPMLPLGLPQATVSALAEEIAANILKGS